MSRCAGACSSLFRKRFRIAPADGPSTSTSTTTEASAISASFTEFEFVFGRPDRLDNGLVVNARRRQGRHLVEPSVK